MVPKINGGGDRNNHGDSSTNRTSPTNRNGGSGNSNNENEGNSSNNGEGNSNNNDGANRIQSASIGGQESQGRGEDSNNEQRYSDETGQERRDSFNSEDDQGDRDDQGDQDHDGPRESTFIPLGSDTSNSRVVAYIQNIPNRYSSIITVNMLLANLHLKNDPLFVQLVNEAVHKDIEAGILGQEEKLENYRKRQDDWDDNLRHLSRTLPYESPPCGGRHFARQNRNVRNTAEYYDEHSAFYVPKLVRCKWSLYVNLNPIPCDLLGRSVDPFVRRVINFFTLARSKDGMKNLGFGFLSFRCRKALNRFHELMEGMRMAPWSAKKLKIGLAHQRDLPSLERHFGQNTESERGSVFWFNQTLDELVQFQEVNRKYWAMCSGRSMMMTKGGWSNDYGGGANNYHNSNAYNNHVPNFLRGYDHKGKPRYYDDHGRHGGDRGGYDYGSGPGGYGGSGTYGYGPDPHNSRRKDGKPGTKALGCDLEHMPQSSTFKGLSVVGTDGRADETRSGNIGSRDRDGRTERMSDRVKQGLINDLLQLNINDVIEICKIVLEIRLSSLSIPHAENLIASSFLRGDLERLIYSVYHHKKSSGAGGRFVEDGRNNLPGDDKGCNSKDRFDTNNDRRNYYSDRRGPDTGPSSGGTGGQYGGLNGGGNLNNISGAAGNQLYGSGGNYSNFSSGRNYNSTFVGNNTSAGGNRYVGIINSGGQYGGPSVHHPPGHPPPGGGGNNLSGNNSNGSPENLLSESLVESILHNPTRLGTVIDVLRNAIGDQEFATTSPGVPPNPSLNHQNQGHHHNLSNSNQGHQQGHHLSNFNQVQHQQQAQGYNNTAQNANNDAYRPWGQ